jgi:D-aspartate ligase
MRRRRPVNAELPVPAVVVGAKLNGLGVIRSLRVGGVPIHVIGTSFFQPAMWSRSCRRLIAKQLHGYRLIEVLLKLRQLYSENPVLFLTDELAVYTVSEQRVHLAGYYRFLLPSKEIVTALADKAKFQQLAEDGGFPVPRSLILNGQADLAKLPNLQFPVVIKLTDKRVVHLGALKSVQCASTPAEAKSLCNDLLASGRQLIVQERIPGPDSDIYFCLFYCSQKGEPVSVFTGRKIRSCPPQVGSTGICVGAPEARVHLEPLTRRFIDYVGFAGLGSVEFKWDSRNNRFVMIEPTVGRTDWQEEIATLSGYNIPLCVYRKALGQQVSTQDGNCQNVIWRESAIRRWPRDVLCTADRVCDGYWRIDDPLPAVVYYSGAWLIPSVAARFRRLISRASSMGIAEGDSPSIFRSIFW